MPDTVHVLLPLSLLEAIRSVDTPDGEEVEYVHELRNKRLGLSDTVYAQIRRYGEAVKRSQPIPAVEASSLSRLIGRRSDADAVFRNAGRILATKAYEKVPRATRRLTHLLPGFLARPIAFRRMRIAFSRYLGATLRRSGGTLLLEVHNSAAEKMSPGAEGCAFYGAMLEELLRLVLGENAPAEHLRCMKSGAAACEWRAVWGAPKATPADRK